MVTIPCLLSETKNLDVKYSFLDQVQIISRITSCISIISKGLSCFILDRCDEIDLSAEEGFACLVKAIQHVVSKKETRRVLFIVDAKYISLKQLAKGGPFFAKKIAAVYKVRTCKLQ